MEVILLSPTPPPSGGIARWSETVIKYFNKRKDVIVHHINTGNNVESIVNRTFYQRFVLPIFRIFYIINQVRTILINNSVDLAHITTSGGFGTIRDIALLFYLKHKHIKVVYHIHFGRVPVIKEKKTLEYRLFEYVIKNVDATIAIDPMTYQSINNLSNCFFVPNPIEEVAYSYSSKCEAVFIGYVIKEKGVIELCEAWTKLNKDFPNWNLSIIGPNEADFVNSLKEKYNNSSIRYVGELPHDRAMEMLKEASIFVLPSYTEGFPYAICEAMFAGKAIVGSNVGAIPFQLADDCGVVCLRQDIDSLTDCLSRLMKDEAIRYRYSVNASKKARKSFAVKEVGEQYKVIWESLLD